MFIKYVIFCAIVVYALALRDGSSYAPEDNHIDQEAVEGHHDEHAYHHPKYLYKYGVEDHHTGDMKSHHEERDGDKVKGEYMVVQPDGKTRIVNYAADKLGGFHAFVTYFGHDHHSSS